MESEEELAGIISHEIAHVVCRHISKKIERSKKIGIATMAGITAGIFLGSGGAATAGNALIVGSMAAGQSVALAYSREEEMQADRIGLEYLTKAGYGGEGLLKILKKIRSKQWFDSNQIPTYLRTHPAVDDRIAYIGTWLENNPIALRKINPYDFRLAHTKLLAMYGDESLTLKKLETKISNSPVNPMSYYGYGLILARTGNYKEAVIYLKNALEKKAFDPNILIDLGRIYFLAGKYQDALNSLEAAVSLVPNDPGGLLFLGRTQMELEKFNEAASSFEELIRKNPDYTQAYYFLAKAYNSQGRKTEIHYLLGIYYKKKGELKNAVIHLERALKNVKDSEKERKIKEMIKEVRKKMKRSRKGG
jgi:predicted Zn-dependent protease